MSDVARPPTIARWLLDSAVGKLPALHAERYRQEWYAECQEAGRDGLLASLRFAFGVRLSAKATAEPLRGWTGGSSGERNASWSTGPSTADVSEQADRRPAEVGERARQTERPEGFQVAQLELAVTAFCSALTAHGGYLYACLLDADTPLGTPYVPLPRDHSWRQLWQVTDTAELDSDHLQNELNWLVSSELRRARRNFGSLIVPQPMIDAMIDAGRRVVSTAVMEWQGLCLPRPPLDEFVRGRVREAYALHIVQPVRERTAAKESSGLRAVA